jgi:hypothetical protein
MIGPRVGPVAGMRAGNAVGVSSDQIAAPGGSLAAVTRDATSGKYVPASLSEWNQVMAVAGIGSGGPGLLWLCQDASGNLADSIDSLPGTVSGTPILYQQPITGWSRLGVTGADAGTAIADSSSASLPDPATAATLIISYAIIVTAPVAIRNIDVMGTANIGTTRVSTTPRFQAVSGGSVVTGTLDPTGAVRPFVYIDDPIAARCAAYTDQEKLVPTRAATTGKRSRFNFGFVGSLLYRTQFNGAAAQLTDAQIKTLLQTLGWTIPWT